MPLGWKEKVNGTDLISVRDVATAIFTGVCARDEEGGFCLPKQKANADSAASTRGAEQCSTRCGKVGAQIALWNGAHADRINGKPTELAKAVALIDSGCAMRDESYCIDEFWAFVGQEKDIAKTVENWTSNCATAASYVCSNSKLERIFLTSNCFNLLLTFRKPFPEKLNIFCFEIQFFRLH